MPKLQLGNIYSFADLPDGAIYRPCSKSGFLKDGYRMKRNKNTACSAVQSEDGRWRRTALQIPLTSIKDIRGKYVAAPNESKSDPHGTVRVTYTGR